MAWNKKATWTWADTLYWFFYIPMTAAVILTLVIIPGRMIGTKVQPVTMDAAIFEERVVQHLKEYSPVTGSSDNMMTTNKSMQFSLSQKKFGYKITKDGKEYYGNQKFYDIARPLAPVKYHRFQSTKTYENGKTVTIDQVYPKLYAKLT